MNGNTQHDYDVAVVGYGPVGATLANLLGQAGLRVAVFEREASVYHQPRASHMDGEVMRIYQSVGLADALQSITIGAKGYLFLNAEGKLLLELKRPEGMGPQGWAYHYRFHQPIFEKVLRAGVERFDNVRVFLRHEVLDVTGDDSKTLLKVENLDEGTVREISASYLVGCDGARSLVRRVMGIAQTDLGLHQPWLVVDIKLRRPVELPAIGIQYCDPSRPTTFIPQIGSADRYRWEIMLMPGDDRGEIERPERVWELLGRWVKPEDAELERASVYTFHSTIARRWRLGRLLIAGDAAHQTPPFLGQGMCAGMRDVSNLAWKLAMVIRGKAPDSLLDTYEREREPHVRAFIEMAIQLGEIIAATDPEVAAERDKRMLAKSPQALTQPEPGLGPGLHGDAPPPAGCLFPQPRLDDGRLLDDAIGWRFAVLGDSGVIEGVSAGTKQKWEAVGAAVLVDPGKEVTQWLAGHSARALILRPDRYVLGVAATAFELDKLSERLP